jgi:hypothetical protein
MARKKIITGIVVAAVMLLSVFWLSSCSNSHGIPNGSYDLHEGVMHTKEYYSDYYWRVKGDTAYYYASGQLTYKGKIINKDGRLYFQLYSVSGIFGKKSGDAFEYEVEYDEQLRLLTVHTTQ